MKTFSIKEVLCLLALVYSTLCQPHFAGAAPNTAQASSSVSTAIVAPLSGVSFGNPEIVEVRVAASSTAGPILKVDLYDLTPLGPVLLDTEDRAPYNFEWWITAADSGSHKLLATATDILGATSDSASIVVNITIPANVRNRVIPEAWLGVQYGQPWHNWFEEGSPENPQAVDTQWGPYFGSISRSFPTMRFGSGRTTKWQIDISGPYVFYKSQIPYPGLSWGPTQLRANPTTRDSYGFDLLRPGYHKGFPIWKSNMLWRSDPYVEHELFGHGDLGPHSAKYDPATQQVVSETGDPIDYIGYGRHTDINSINREQMGYLNNSRLIRSSGTFILDDSNALGSAHAQLLKIPAAGSLVGGLLNNSDGDGVYYLSYHRNTEIDAQGSTKIFGENKLGIWLAKSNYEVSGTTTANNPVPHFVAWQEVGSTYSDPNTGIQIRPTRALGSALEVQVTLPPGYDPGPNQAPRGRLWPARYARPGDTFQVPIVAIDDGTIVNVRVEMKFPNTSVPIPAWECSLSARPFVCNYNLPSTLLAGDFFYLIGYLTDNKGAVGYTRSVRVDIVSPLATGDPLDRARPYTKILDIVPASAGKYRVSATAADDQGLTRVNFFASGHFIGADTTAPYEVLWDPSKTPTLEGDYLVRAEAVDLSGNIGRADTYVRNFSEPLWRDSVAPQASIDWRLVNGNSIRVSYLAADNQGLMVVAPFVNGKGAGQSEHTNFLPLTGSLRTSKGAGVFSYLPEAVIRERRTVLYQVFAQDYGGNITVAEARIPVAELFPHLFPASPPPPPDTTSPTSPRFLRVE